MTTQIRRYFCHYCTSFPGCIAYTWTRPQGCLLNNGTDLNAFWVVTHNNESQDEVWEREYKAKQPE